MFCVRSRGRGKAREVAPDRLMGSPMPATTTSRPEKRSAESSRARAQRLHASSETIATSSASPGTALRKRRPESTAARRACHARRRRGARRRCRGCATHGCARGGEAAQVAAVRSGAPRPQWRLRPTWATSTLCHHPPPNASHHVVFSPPPPVALWYFASCFFAWRICLGGVLACMVYCLRRVFVFCTPGAFVWCILRCVCFFAWHVFCLV